MRQGRTKLLLGMKDPIKSMTFQERKESAGKALEGKANPQTGPARLMLVIVIQWIRDMGSWEYEDDWFWDSCNDSLLESTGLTRVDVVRIMQAAEIIPESSKKKAAEILWT